MATRPAPYILEPAGNPSIDAGDGLAEFAWKKIETIAELNAGTRDIPAFWFRLAELVHQHSRGSLGAQIANMKMMLYRSRKATAARTEDLVNVRTDNERLMHSLKLDVEVLRATLRQAVEALVAAKERRPWRYAVDEVLTRCKMALKVTAPKPEDPQ